MSVKDLIEVISIGDSVAINQIFIEEMSNRISKKLNELRMDVAKNMFQTELTKVRVTQRNPDGPDVQTVGAEVSGTDRSNRAEKIRTMSVKHLRAHGNEGDKAAKGVASLESENKVQSMVKHLKSGKTLPHPLVDHEGNVLDGHHRVEAHYRAGIPTMKVRQIPSALIKRTVNSEKS